MNRGTCAMRVSSSPHCSSFRPPRGRLAQEARGSAPPPPARPGRWTRSAGSRVRLAGSDARSPCHLPHLCAAGAGGPARRRRHPRRRPDHAVDQGRERRLGSHDRPDRSGRLSLQLQRRRGRDHRSAQPVDERIQQQRVEPRRACPAPTSWTRRTCRTAPWPPITYNSTALERVPPDARLHAAGLRDRHRRSIRSSTCCTAPATATTRGPRSAAPASSSTT